ncbi:MAG: PTS sugar transporter subunit IIA [Lachnospiraceae bacterium]|nr:PTS sugar transporter subunit IIA [Lachnospiraceae bacterium]
MIGILIATHGGFADGLLSAVELLAGKQEKVKTIGLYHGDGIDEFTEKVAKAYKELDDGDGVMTFVDILGGSPSNAVMKLMNEKPDVKAIAGVNMPMVIQAVFMREGSTVEELCDICSGAGKEGQILLHEKYQEMMAEIAEEEDDF